MNLTTHLLYYSICSNEICRTLNLNSLLEMSQTSGPQGVYSTVL